MNYQKILEKTEAWAECIAGALEKKEYLGTIKKAGFRDIDIVSQNKFYEQGLDNTLVGKITSVKVKAHKS